MLYLDTHVVVWLYAMEFKKFPVPALDAIEQNPLIISPMVRLELQSLNEIKKVNYTADQIIDELHYNIDLCVYDGPMDFVIQSAMGINWTRDPFDRLIVANAMAEKMPLVTKDKIILRHYPHAVWDIH